MPGSTSAVGKTCPGALQPRPTVTGGTAIWSPATIGGSKRASVDAGATPARGHRDGHDHTRLSVHHQRKGAVVAVATMRPGQPL